MSNSANASADAYSFFPNVPAPTPPDFGAITRGLPVERRLKTLRERREHWLPYGMWTCADGREVLFNRRYAPIWSRRPGQYAQQIACWEFVDWITQCWLFDDSVLPPWDDRADPEVRARVHRALRDFLVGAEVTGFKPTGLGDEFNSDMTRRTA